MTPVELTVAAEMARNDLYFYARFMFKERRRLIWQRARHHHRVTDALMRVYRGECKRLILNLPPRYSKTQLAVEAFISWCFGKAPDSEFIHTSYSAPLAVGNSWQVRETMKHPTYRTVFPNTALSTDSASKDHWRTTAGGVMYATGAEGSITGYGAGKMRHGFGGCFPYHQHVETEAGPVAIGDLVRDARSVQVWSKNETTGSRELRQVDRFWTNPANDLIRVHLADGSSFECTPDHDVLTAAGWVAAIHLAQPFDLVKGKAGLACSFDPGEGGVDGDSDDAFRMLWACVPLRMREVLSARFPRFAHLDLPDHAHDDVETFGQLLRAFRRLEYLHHLGPVQFGARSPLENGESAVPKRVLHVVGLCAIREIARRVVNGIAVEVPDLISRGSWAYELLCDEVRYVSEGYPTAYGEIHSEVAFPIGTRLKRAQGNSAPDLPEARHLVKAEGVGYQSPVFVEYVGHVDRTFCLEVEGNNNFELSQSGVIVSNCIIIDDPHKADEALSDTKRKAVLSNFTTTIESRKNDPMNTPIIVIMQRLHEEDLAGWLEAGGNGEKWEVVRIPVLDDDDEPIWPEKHSREVLHAMEAANPYVFAGQYRQIPAPPAGGNFQPGKIQIVDAVPAGVTSIVRGWDLAASKNSGAFTAGVKLGRIASTGQTIILDVQREQGGPHDVRRLIKGTASQDELGTLQSLPQDPGQAGKVQVGDLGTLLNGFVCKFSPESGDKVARADPFASQVNIGNVLMVKAPWNKTLTDEMTMFPNGKFKDQVDACSRAFAEMDNSMERFMALAGRG